MVSNSWLPTSVRFPSNLLAKVKGSFINSVHLRTAHNIVDLMNRARKAILTAAVRMAMANLLFRP